MIVLNWNIRGVGDLDKRAKVRDFIYLFGFDLVALQETNLWPLPSIFSALLGKLKSMNGRYLILSVLREDS